MIGKIPLYTVSLLCLNYSLICSYKFGSAGHTASPTKLNLIYVLYSIYDEYTAEVDHSEVSS